MNVHLISGSGKAKFWLESDIELEKNYRYSRTELREIESLIENHQNDLYRDELIGTWRDHFQR